MVPSLPLSRCETLNLAAAARPEGSSPSDVACAVTEHWAWSQRPSEVEDMPSISDEAGIKLLNILEMFGREMLRNKINESNRLRAEARDAKAAAKGLSNNGKGMKKQDYTTTWFDSPAEAQTTLRELKQISRNCLPTPPSSATSSSIRKTERTATASTPTPFKMPSTTSAETIDMPPASSISTSSIRAKRTRAISKACPMGTAPASLSGNSRTKHPRSTPPTIAPSCRITTSTPAISATRSSSTSAIGTAP